MKPFASLFMSLALLGIAAIPGHAAVIFTTGNNPPTFSPSSGNGITGTVGFAEPFTPSGNFLFSSFTAPFDPTGTGATSAIGLSLRQDNGAGVPGAILESFTFTPSVLGDQYVTENSIIHPLLSSGVKYWFAVVAVGGGPTVFWDLANPSVSGTIANSNTSGASWGGTLNGVPLSAFLVNGDPPGAAVIPEPPTLPILAGCLGVAGWWWRRRKVTTA
jgi:hypothetical protein